jgi:hypothetical protein
MVRVRVRVRVRVGVRVRVRGAACVAVALQCLDAIYSANRLVGKSGRTPERNGIDTRMAALQAEQRRETQ